MDVHKGGGGPAHVDRGEGGQKRDFFVDIINGWPLNERDYSMKWVMMTYSVKGL